MISGQTTSGFSLITPKIYTNKLWVTKKQKVILEVKFTFFFYGQSLATKLIVILSYNITQYLFIK